MEQIHTETDITDPDDQITTRKLMSSKMEHINFSNTEVLEVQIPRTP